MGRGKQAGVAPACCQLFLRDLGTGRLQELCLTVGPPVLPCLCPLDHHSLLSGGPFLPGCITEFPLGKYNSSGLSRTGSLAAVSPAAPAAR